MCAVSLVVTLWSLRGTFVFSSHLPPQRIYETWIQIDHVYIVTETCTDRRGFAAIISNWETLEMWTRVTDNVLVIFVISKLLFFCVIYDTQYTLCFAASPYACAWLCACMFDVVVIGWRWVLHVYIQTYLKVGHVHSWTETRIVRQREASSERSSWVLSST